jgi:emp24/gp25L/p24 family/GOLD
MKLLSPPNVDYGMFFNFRRGSFEVFDDDVDGRNVDVQITNQATGVTIYRSPRGSTDGSFELVDLGPSTRIQLCFHNLYDNENGFDNSYDVGFTIRVSSRPRGLDDGVIGPDTERALKLVEKAAEIHKDWELMKDHQVFTRNREAIHTEMSEKILANLSWWTFTESFLVIGMAVAQVMYWKRFFETRRYL